MPTSSTKIATSTPSLKGLSLAMTTSRFAGAPADLSMPITAIGSIGEKRREDERRRHDADRHRQLHETLVGVCQQRGDDEDDDRDISSMDRSEEAGLQEGTPMKRNPILALSAAAKAAPSVRTNVPDLLPLPSLHIFGTKAVLSHHYIRTIVLIGSACRRRATRVVCDHQEIPP